MSVLHYNLQQILKDIPFKEMMGSIPFTLHDLQGELIASNSTLPKNPPQIFSKELQYRDIPILTLKGDTQSSEVYTKLEQVIYQEIKLYDKMNFLSAQTALDKASFEDVLMLLQTLHRPNYKYPQILERALALLRIYIPVETCSIFLVQTKEEDHSQYLKGTAGIYNGEPINFTDAKTWDMDSSSILGITALNQQYYISPTTAQDPNYKTVSDYDAPTNLACFPIVFNSTLLGVLNLKNNLKGSYKPTDINFIHRFLLALAHIVYSTQQNEILGHVKNINTELGKYISQNVVEDITQSGGIQKRGEGVKKKAVCLFCDIRSFTSISEKLEPAKLVTLLNIYFSELIPIIEKYDGTVDKLVGDMIAAFWNLPQDVLEPELKAAKAAIEMQKTMIRKVVPAWVNAGVPRVGIGIGLYSGQVIAGNIGASQLMNYTVIGDTVHNAEQLESLARPGEIMISEEIFKITEGKILKPERTDNNITFKGQKKPGSAYVLKPIEYPDY